MQIVLTRSGGFATVPALSGPFVIDTEALARPEREEVERLVGEARLTSAPNVSVAAGSADHLQYEVTVVQGGTAVSATFTSPIADPDVHRLVTRLERLARGEAG